MSSLSTSSDLSQRNVELIRCPPLSHHDFDLRDCHEGQSQLALGTQKAPITQSFNSPQEPPHHAVTLQQSSTQTQCRLPPISKKSQQDQLHEGSSPTTDAKDAETLDLRQEIVSVATLSPPPGPKRHDTSPANIHNRLRSHVERLEDLSCGTQERAQHILPCL